MTFNLNLLFFLMISVIADGLLLAMAYKKKFLMALLRWLTEIVKEIVNKVS